MWVIFMLTVVVDPHTRKSVGEHDQSVDPTDMCDLMSAMQTTIHDTYVMALRHRKGRTGESLYLVVEITSIKPCHVIAF